MGNSIPKMYLPPQLDVRATLMDLSVGPHVYSGPYGSSSGLQGVIKHNAMFVTS